MGVTERDQVKCRGAGGGGRVQGQDTVEGKVCIMRGRGGGGGGGRGHCIPYQGFNGHREFRVLLKAALCICIQKDPRARGAGVGGVIACHFFTLSGQKCVTLAGRRCLLQKRPGDKNALFSISNCYSIGCSNL